MNNSLIGIILALRWAAHYALVDNGLKDIGDKHVLRFNEHLKSVGHKEVKRDFAISYMEWYLRESQEDNNNNYE